MTCGQVLDVDLPISKLLRRNWMRRRDALMRCISSLAAAAKARNSHFCARWTKRRSLSINESAESVSSADARSGNSLSGRYGRFSVDI